MRSAISASLILRSKVCSLDSRKFLATCWVMVEAPCCLPRLGVGQRGAHDALGVDAAVLVEVLVLGRQEGADHDLRHRLDRQVEPALAGVFGEQRAVRRRGRGSSPAARNWRARRGPAGPGCTSSRSNRRPRRAITNSTAPALNRKPKKRRMRRIRCSARRWPGRMPESAHPARGVRSRRGRPPDAPVRPPRIAGSTAVRRGVRTPRIDTVFYGETGATAAERRVIGAAGLSVARLPKNWSIALAMEPVTPARHSADCSRSRSRLLDR